MTLAGGEITARLVAFVGTALLTRRLGPDGFGVVGFALAISGYLTLVVNSGLGDVGTREVAAHPERAARTYVNILGVRLVLAVAAFAALAVLCLFLPKPLTVKLVVLLFGLSFLSLAIDPSWAYKGLERQTPAAAGQILTQVVYVVGIMFAVRGPDDLTRVPLAQFAGEAAVGIALALPFLMRSMAFSWREGRRLLVSSGFISAARILRTLIITFDVVFLGFAVSNAQVGLYTASYRFCFVLMAIAGASSMAYLPAFSRAYAQGTTAVQHLLNHAVGFSAFVGAPLVAGAVVLARPLLFLLFGAPFGEAAPAFSLLVLSMGFVFVHSLFAVLFLVLHRTQDMAKVYGVAAATNVAVNIFAIPRFGIVGAASATLIAEAVILGAGMVALRGAGIHASLRPALRPALAAAAMALVVGAASSHLPLAASVVLGAATYGGVLLIIVGPAGIGRLMHRSE